LIDEIKSLPAKAGTFVRQDAVGAQRYVIAMGGQSDSKLNDYKEFFSLLY